MDVCAQPFCDFANFYYPLGEAIFQTKLPPEGFVYSPGYSSCPIPGTGIDTSLFFWGILQAIFIILYLLAVCRLVPARKAIE
jgi:hypothetical protein